ncbi:unnamed protein product, partial [Discosporangium mesarthrocarpum]
MNRALSASDLSLVLWLCNRLDPQNTPHGLSQHILLCLIQQLGSSDMHQDTSIKLQWLQQCSLALEPTDPKIRQHVQHVLAQLRAGLESIAHTVTSKGGTDASTLRVLVHVVNSL